MLDFLLDPFNYLFWIFILIIIIGAITIIWRPFNIYVQFAYINAKVEAIGNPFLTEKELNRLIELKNIIEFKDALNTNKDYDLGVTATVSSNSYMVQDLNGNKALNIQELKNAHTDIFSQYTKPQSNDSTVFIDPENPDIKEIATDVYNKASSDNSFIVAKELFKWLKQNTDYQ